MDRAGTTRISSCVGGCTTMHGRKVCPARRSYSHLLQHQQRRRLRRSFRRLQSQHRLPSLPPCLALPPLPLPLPPSRPSSSSLSPPHLPSLSLLLRRPKRSQGHASIISQHSRLEVDQHSSEHGQRQDIPQLRHCCRCLLRQSRRPWASDRHRAGRSVEHRRSVRQGHQRDRLHRLLHLPNRDAEGQRVSR